MNLADKKSEVTTPQPSVQTAQVVAYYRLELEGDGEPNERQPQVEPVLREGQARIVKAAPGTIVQGTLVDCPETQNGIGCVVVDTGEEVVAVQSAVLCHLLIEHAPCRLEFVAVPLQDHAGRFWWDWEAYEISPNGGHVLVSDPHVEFRVTPTADWREEIRNTILPALRLEIRELETREKRLQDQLDGDVPSLAASLMRRLESNQRTAGKPT